MVELQDRFACALMGACLEAVSYKEMETGLFPPLASAEDLEKRRLELQDERLVSLEGFCKQLLKNPDKDPRYFEEGIATPLISPIIPAALLFARKPDSLSRFIRRLYYEKAEASHDFALVYTTTLVEILYGKSPQYAVDFAVRTHQGGGTFSDLKTVQAWVLRVFATPLVEIDAGGVGYIGALMGAHSDMFAIQALPTGWRRIESLAQALYEASQYVEVGKY